MANNDYPWCPHCLQPLEKSEIEGYAWQCRECDEDFYDFEVIHGEEDFDQSETMGVCAWCGEHHPAKELYVEEQVGLICGKCKDALRSRGEKLVIEDN